MTLPNDAKRSGSSRGRRPIRRGTSGILEFADELRRRAVCEVDLTANGTIVHMRLSPLMHLIEKIFSPEGQAAIMDGIAKALAGRQHNGGG